MKTTFLDIHTRTLAVCLALAAGCDGSQDSDLPSNDVQVSLAVGSSGASVRLAVEQLSSRGYFPNAELSAEFPDWRPVIPRNPEDPSHFGQDVESAVSEFQERMGLAPTGIIDAETSRVLSEPHCGVPESATVDRAEKFALYRNYPRFSKTNINWRIERYPGNIPVSTVDSKFAAAFTTWSAATTLNFFQVGGSGNPDIRIRFEIPGQQPAGFLDPAGALGIAFTNSTGSTRTITMNNLENWTSQPDLETVALHEIGHLLGLDHSTVNSPVMKPSLARNEVRRALALDDKQAVGAIYGAWRQMPGLAVDVAAGGTRENPDIWVTSGNNTVFRWNAAQNRFDNVPGNGVSISVGPNSIPWVVSSDNSLWAGDGFFGAWQRKGNARDVAVMQGVLGNNTWIIGTRATSGGNFVVQKLTDPNNNTWTDSDQSGIRVAVDARARVWVVKADRTIVRRTLSNGTTGGWEAVPGCATDIAAGADGDVWAVDGCNTDGAGNFLIWQWNEQEPASGSGSETIAERRKEWVNVPGLGTRIAAAPNALPVVAQKSGNIFRRVPR